MKGPTEKKQQIGMFHTVIADEKDMLHTCLAEGVIPVCTTMIARLMFSSCIRVQYLKRECMVYDVM